VIRAAIGLVILAVGFGLGVYWGVKYPIQAQKLASEEERRFVEAQKILLERVKQKLNQYASTQPTTVPTTTPGTFSANANSGRAGFVSASQSPAPRPDPEVDELRRESERQIAESDRLLQQSRRR
jgi:hypothetical protein